MIIELIAQVIILHAGEALRLVPVEESTDVKILEAGVTFERYEPELYLDVDKMLLDCKPLWHMRIPYYPDPDCRGFSPDPSINSILMENDKCL